MKKDYRQYLRDNKNKSTLLSDLLAFIACGLLLATLSVLFVLL